MTQTANAIYKFLDEYITQHHCSPSIREIAHGCGIGIGTVSRYLNYLESQGYIARKSGFSRSITLLQEPRGIKNT